MARALDLVKAGSLIARTKQQRRDPVRKPVVSPLACRWRLPVAALAISVFLGGLMVPPASLWLAQVGEMVPAVGELFWKEPYQAAARRVANDRPIVAVRRVFEALHQAKPDENALAVGAALDPANGLYVYLRLLPILRQEAIGQDTLRQRLSSATTAAPARLYVMRERQLAYDAFRKAGVPARRAATAAMRIDRVVANLVGLPPRGWPATHLPVLGDLADRLGQYGERSREAGRVSDAVAAHAAVARLLTDVVEDSPEPSLVLTAAELLANAMDELALDMRAIETSQTDSAPTVEPSESIAGKLGPEELATACRGEAAKLRDFHARWHTLVRSEGVSVLPMCGDTCHALLAAPTHHRVMTSFCLVPLAAAAWAGFWLVCLAAIPGAVVSVWSENVVEWRSGRWSYALAVVLPILPIAMLWLGLSTWTVPQEWLTSQPTVQAWAAWPLVALVLIGVSTRLTLRVAGSPERDRQSVRFAWAVLLTMGALVLLALVVGGWWGESWQPPAAVRRFRLAGWILGAAAAGVLLVWVIRAITHWRAGLTALPSRSRAYLQAVSVALLSAGCLLWLCLWVNQVRDVDHQEGYAQAALRPVSDLIGNSWYQERFAASRRLAQTAWTYSAGEAP